MTTYRKVSAGRASRPTKFPQAAVQVVALEFLAQQGASVPFPPRDGERGQGQAFVQSPTNSALATAKHGSGSDASNMWRDPDGRVRDPISSRKPPWWQPVPDPDAKLLTPSLKRPGHDRWLLQELAPQQSA